MTAPKGARLYGVSGQRASPLSESRTQIDPEVCTMERLKRRTDFRAAAEGVRAPGKAFVLQARPRGDDGAVRVGFTVSRQVGNAVERNRVKRRLRELVRLAAAPVAGGPALCPGHDYVLIGRRAALQLQFADMMRDLDNALRRVHAEPARKTAAQRSDAAPTGSADARPLHTAGSAGRPRRHRQERSKPPAPSRHEPQQHGPKNEH